MDNRFQGHCVAEAYALSIPTILSIIWECLEIGEDEEIQGHPTSI